MRRSALFLNALILGLAVETIGQERPDFSGTWTATASGDAAGGAGTSSSLGSGWGTSFTLIQDASTLVLKRMVFARADLQPAMTFLFALDGSETENTVMMGRGEQVQVSTTAWDGDKLVITTVYHVQDAGDGRRVTSEVKQTLSLQPQQAGRTVWPPSLVIETVRSGVLGGPPSTARTVYDRN